MSVTIREFNNQDAQEVSDVIRQTMRISNAKDYSKHVLEPLIAYFSPEKVIALNNERHCLVAEVEGRVVGTIAIERDELLTFFVDPDYQGLGIGAKLLRGIEAFAVSNGINQLEVNSSLTAADFYERRGYKRTGKEKTASAGRQIEMRKFLDSSCT